MNEISFNLDGILINLDIFNNDAYNYALKKFDYPQILVLKED